MTRILLTLTACLILAKECAAFSYYQDSWVSSDGGTIYASASTSTDDQDVVASATVRIRGAGVFSPISSFRKWFGASVQTSLAATPMIDSIWDIILNHWDQITMAITVVFQSEIRWTDINYRFFAQEGPVCFYEKDCPNGKGICGPTPINGVLELGQSVCAPYRHRVNAAWRYPSGTGPWKCANTGFGAATSAPVICTNP